MKAALRATTILAVAFWATAAQAQQLDSASRQVTPVEPPTDSADLAEIVVTAQRRAENLQDVPIVVSTVSGERLTSSGLSNLAQINTLVPGLTLRQAAGSVQTSIRGVGSSFSGGENTAAIYIDDVYLPLQRDGLRELPDVEQIAVLKGPQGTLFGRNATAGVIQISTKEPTRDLTFSADATLGNYDTVRLNAFVSGGLAVNLRASLSAQYEEQGEGYGRNLITGSGASQLLHSFAIRGKLLYEPGDTTTITLAGDYLDRNANLHALHPTPGTSFILPLGPLGSPRDYYSNIDPNFKLQSGGGSLTIAQEMGFATLKSVSAYRESMARNIFDVVPQGVPLFYVEFPNSPADSFSQELQLNSNPDSSIKWSAGAFYFRAFNASEPQNLIFNSNLFGGKPPPFTPSLISFFGRERTESIAGYAQADLELTPRTTLTVGGRYTYEQRVVQGKTDVVFFGGIAVPGQPVRQSVSVEKPTWRIALNHKFNDDVMAYASYNRGFKSGGFNIASPADPAYEPEQLDAYEIGMKTELFDRRLRLNIGGFYYDYQNIQVTQFIDGGNITGNGAKAQIYGVDVDFLARVTPEFTLSGGLSIANNKFLAYPNAFGATPNPFPPGGTTPRVNFDAAGNSLPGAQKYTGTILADYVTDVSFGRLSFNLTANYNGEQFFEPDNFIRQAPYWILNTSVRWTSTNGRYSLTAWGRNLTDELVITGGATLNLASLVAYEAPPRIYGITAGVKF